MRAPLQLICLVLLALLPGCAPERTVPGELPAVYVARGRLMAGNSTFEVRGVNYIHTTRDDLLRCSALQFGGDGNCPWQPQAIAEDLAGLRARGVNTVRVFLNYYVFGGARALDPAYSLATPLAHLDAFVAEANRQGIYVLPVLLAKYPQDRFGPEHHAAALELHVRPVVRHLAGRPGLLGWDLFNEPDLGGPVDQRCWDWDNADFPLCFPLANQRLQFVQAMHNEVKALDPTRLTTVSMGFAKNYFEPQGADLRLADLVDFFAFHYYDNDPYDSGRYSAHWYYGQGFPADLRRGIVELHQLRLDKPVVITELGFPTGPGALRVPAALQPELRLALETARAEGASGVMLWPFQTHHDELPGTLFATPLTRSGPLRPSAPTLFWALRVLL